MSLCDGNVFMDAKSETMMGDWFFVQWWWILNNPITPRLHPISYPPNKSHYSLWAQISTHAECNMRWCTILELKLRNDAEPMVAKRSTRWGCQYSSTVLGRIIIYYVLTHPRSNFYTFIRIVTITVPKATNDIMAITFLSSIILSSYNLVNVQLLTLPFGFIQGRFLIKQRATCMYRWLKKSQIGADGDIVDEIKWNHNVDTSSFCCWTQLFKLISNNHSF